MDAHSPLDKIQGFVSRSLQKARNPSTLHDPSKFQDGWQSGRSRTLGKRVYLYR